MDYKCLQIKDIQQSSITFMFVCSLFAVNKIKVVAVHVMTTYRTAEVEICSAPDGHEKLHSRTGHFTLLEEFRDNRIGSHVSPWIGPDVLVNRKTHFLFRNSNPELSTV